MSDSIRAISGNIVDIANRRIYPGTIDIEGDRITVHHQRSAFLRDISASRLRRCPRPHRKLDACPTGIRPPRLVHGTVATVSDPHEIANVLGAAGIHLWWTTPGCAAEVPLRSSRLRPGTRPLKPPGRISTDGAFS